ncbi:MAG: SDR family NAD(P)-dependent oxidoreductase, partial [Akkermansiaceae bacterium]|nr:SDR family NAD(P)-dependent oxidoreductase [Akkermansiaceae bacterium]
MGRVDGKIALVTGGASGIGRGCALRLAEEGARVAVSDLQDEAGEAVVEEIRAAGGDAIYLHQDVTDEGVWVQTVEQVANQFGGLSVLVNNAGIGLIGPVTEFSLEDWRRQIAVNLDGVFLGTKHAVPVMRQGGGGSIINMSSVAGLQGGAGFSGYCATKGGVRLFTKAVAIECAREHIRVNSVHPGVIDTPIWTTVQSGEGAEAVAPDPKAIAAGVVPTGEV